MIYETLHGPFWQVLDLILLMAVIPSLSLIHAHTHCRSCIYWEVPQDWSNLLFYLYICLGLA